MSTQSVPRSPGKHDPPSTRELTADEAFCKLLAEDLQIKETTARTVFLDEPKVRCIRVVEWALRNVPDDPERRAKILLWWAKKQRAGAFRPDNTPDTLAGIFDQESRRFEALAEALAKMWVENPDSLAQAIRALEHSRNGNGRS